MSLDQGRQAHAARASPPWIGLIETKGHKYPGREELRANLLLATIEIRLIFVKTAGSHFSSPCFSRVVS
jgi:hypothetical protein